MHLLADYSAELAMSVEIVSKMGEVQTNYANPYRSG